KMFSKGEKYTVLGYDFRRREIYVDRSHSGLTSFSKAFATRVGAPLHLNSPRLRLEVLADRSSVELFADNGHVVLTNLVFPEEDAFGLEAFSSNGATKVEIQASTLRSTWR
ncbi:MAG: GH32 C-terminal domain-containing protein, partial [Bryobacteraceae bacterium]